MNKEEFRKEITRVSGVDPETVKHVLNVTLDVAGETLAEGIELGLRGFGRFTTKHVAERTGRNPATGEPMHIPGYRKIAFTPSKEVKERLNKR